MSTFKGGDIAVVHNYKRWRDLLFKVDGVEGAELVMHPRGGGRVYRVPASQMRLATPEEINPALQLSYFYGDWLEDEQGKSVFIQGYTNGELWNGWAMPWFTKEEAQRILTLQVKLEESPTCAYDPQRDLFFQLVDGAKKEEEDVLTHGDLKLYSLGRGSWCWNEYDPDSEEDLALIAKQFPKTT